MQNHRVTRNINKFHLSQPRLTIYRNGVYYMGIKAFNHLPSHIKRLSDDKNNFKNTLKNYLLIHSFYSLNNFLIVIVNSYVCYKAFLIGLINMNCLYVGAFIVLYF
jgi:hypothetical protein